MKWSYSRVECFKQCPKQYQYRYVDGVEVLSDQKPDNALYLGSALHKGSETTVEEGLADYLSNYYVLTDSIINWQLQLEYWIPKVKALLPENGQHEAEIQSDDYVGFIDYVTSDTIYDFKFTVPKNYEKYLESDQLKIYKHYWEKQNPGTHIKHLKYIFIPKCNIRQKKTETIQEFRQRLLDELQRLSIEVIEVPFDDFSITSFTDECKVIENAKDYPKCTTKLCDWCGYKNYCLRGVDWDVKLPENKKRDVQKKKITELPDTFIYGASYVGKSTVLDSLDNVLFINTDGNYDMYKNPSVFIGKTVTMNGRMKEEKSAWENFLDVISELEKKDNTFKYVCLDLVEDLREHCRVYMCSKLKIQHESDSAYSKGWDMVTTEFNQAIKRIKAAGYILLLVSKEVGKEITDAAGAKYTTFNPNLPEKSSNILAGMVKLTARVYVDDKGERWFNLEPNPNWFGGGRFNFKVNRCALSIPELLKAINEAEEVK